MRRISRFPYLLWHWTCAHESLFELDRAELAWYVLLVKAAEKRHV